jgi:voltage-gated potassium channel
MKTKRRIYQIIEKAAPGDKKSRTFDLCILTLICINIFAIILESHANIYAEYKLYFDVFEVVSVLVFSIEYLLRLWTAHIRFHEHNRLKAVLIQMKMPLTIIDLLAILPFYLPMILPFDLRFLRLFRIARFFRILKLNRYSKALVFILQVLSKKKDVLLATMYIMGMTILMSAVFMFYAENGEQPENFSSITATLWWAVATLTTVGYGDIYPVTIVGKVLATVIAITGIGVVALPTGIISSGFIEELRDHQTDDFEESVVCPHCSKKIC